MKVDIGIYDENGVAIKTLARGEQEPGRHLLEWDGTDDGGRPVPAGAYYLQVAMEGRVIARYKVTLEEKYDG